MAAVERGHVIDLSEYLDLSKYSFYDRPYARLSSYYRFNGDVVNSPGFSLS